jgi:ribosome-associated toxin RatA of RatAB toxin-antitoxin module
MGQIHLQQRLEHPASTVWLWIKDYGNIQRIHPMIGNARIEGEKECGVGAVRFCEMKMGGFYLKERVTDWKESQSYTVDIYETSMPLMKRSLATFGVRPSGSDSSEVYMDIEYTMKYGVLGKIMDVLFMNAMMKMMMKAMFTKLDTTLSGAETKKKIAFA